VGGKWPPEAFIARRLTELSRNGFRVTYAAGGSRRGAAIVGVRAKQLPGSSMSLARRAVVLMRGLLTGLVSNPRRTAKTIQLSRGAATGRLAFLELLLPFAAERADCLHFEWNLAAVDYLPLFELMGCPVVISCRGSQLLVAPHNPGRRAACSRIPETFDKASLIHCVSEAVARAAQGLGADPAKVRVIRPAVDIDQFRPVARNERRGGPQFRIVMTCMLTWVKGYEYALQAVADLVRRGVDARLTIIGGADKTNRQRALYTIHDLNLQDRVEMLGPQPQDQVAQALRESDAFLLTSVSEGISNAVLEAMASGLPVVVTACPGMEEAITDGVDGFLAPLRDSGAVADSLEALAGDARLRERIGSAARKKVVEKFEIARQSQEWLALYWSLATYGAERSAAGTARGAVERLLARH
jgi:glycosyltransferase involved in cell wall biosynthesis